MARWEVSTGTRSQKNCGVFAQLEIVKGDMYVVAPQTPEVPAVVYVNTVDRSGKKPRELMINAVGPAYGAGSDEFIQTRVKTKGLLFTKRDARVYPGVSLRSPAAQKTFAPLVDAVRALESLPSTGDPFRDVVTSIEFESADHSIRFKRHYKADTVDPRLGKLLDAAREVIVAAPTWPQR